MGDWEGWMCTVESEGGKAWVVGICGVVCWDGGDKGLDDGWPFIGLLGVWVV
ncbi:hypothetical protein SESBI_17278 [Sesbania bispinosa]|nr:hypothetical protein SESBI_17278 [Sesbania bispinosa]